MSVINDIKKAITFKRTNKWPEERLSNEYCLDLKDGAVDNGKSRGVITGSSSIYWPCLGALAIGVANNNISFAVADHGLVEWQKKELNRIGVKWIEHDKPNVDNVKLGCAPNKCWWKPYICMASPFDTTFWVDSDAIVCGNLSKAFDKAEINFTISTQIKYSNSSANYLNTPVDYPFNIVRKYAHELGKINAGVLGFSLKHKSIIEEWEDICGQVRKYELIYDFGCHLMDQYGLGVLVARSLESPSNYSFDYLDSIYNWPADSLHQKDQHKRLLTSHNPNLFYMQTCERHPKAKIVHWLGPDEYKPFLSEVKQVHFASGINKPAWIIPFFYFSNNQMSKYRSNMLKRFFDNLKLVDIPIYVVEGYVNNQQPIIEKSSVNDVYHVPFNSILWQKERLINFAISKIPADIDSVGWIDADVLFCSNSVKDDIIRALNKYSILQPWQHCYMISENGDIDFDYFTGHKTNFSGIGWSNRGDIGSLHPPYQLPGYAWCARRDTLDTIGGLYEYGITGSGDTITAAACYNICDLQSTRCIRFPQSLQSHYISYMKKAYAATGGRIGYINGDIIHMYHGNIANRLHKSRNDVLFESNLCEDYLEVSEHGALEWTSIAPLKLQDDVAKLWQ